MNPMISIAGSVHLAREHGISYFEGLDYGIQDSGAVYSGVYNTAAFQTCGPPYKRPTKITAALAPVATLMTQTDRNISAHAVRA